MKMLCREDVYNGRIIKVYKDDVLLEDGSSTIREVVVHKQGAAVVAVDDEGKVLMVRQHRYPIHMELLELPAGLMDEGETPLVTAQRELLEETGYTASHWDKLISVYTSPGCHDELVHIYLATGLNHVTEQSLDKDEMLTFQVIPFDEVLEQVMTGKLMDGKTIIGILHYSALTKR